jgi:hypothetical protein
VPDRQSTGPRGRVDRYREPVDSPSARTRRRATLQPTTVVSNNRRGLTAFGATLVVLIFSIVGTAADIAVFGSLSWIFAVLFVLSCLAATLRSHIDDLVAVAIMPPLVYALITVGVGILHPASSGSGGGLKAEIINVGSELILRAPSLLVAEVLVIITAVVRARRATVARRQRASAANRRGVPLR